MLGQGGAVRHGREGCEGGIDGMSVEVGVVTRAVAGGLEQVSVPPKRRGSDL